MNCDGELKTMVDNYNCDDGNLPAELKVPCKTANVSCTSIIIGKYCNESMHVVRVKFYTHVQI